MPVNSKTKTMVFAEQDVDFINKLAGDIGCHFFKANERTYSLNKFASDVHGEMGVFAWVHKEGNDCFWISTRKIWVEAARARVTAGRNLNCFARDTRQAEDSVSFNTQDDYDKTVSALRMINQVR